MYKSQVQESPEDWKIFMPDVNKDVLLDIKLDNSSQHFFNHLLKDDKSKKSNVSNAPNVQKINGIIQGEQKFEPD